MAMNLNTSHAMDTRTRLPISISSAITTSWRVFSLPSDLILERVTPTHMEIGNISKTMTSDQKTPEFPERSKMPFKSTYGIITIDPRKRL